MSRKITLASCACAYCGARWLGSQKQRNLRYDVTEREVVCARGYGCAAQTVGHSRVRDGILEFLLEGYWYTIGQLADLAGKPPSVIRMRLTKRKWTPRDAVEYRRSRRSRRGHDRLVRRAAMKAKRDRDEALARERAIELGISERTMRNRIARTGSLDAAVAMGPKGGVVGNGGPIATAARLLGISPKAAHKAASKRGIATREELLRRASIAGGTLAERVVELLKNARARKPRRNVQARDDRSRIRRERQKGSP